MSQAQRTLVFSALMLSAAVTALQAEEKLPFLHSLFSDNMVLQRGIETRIWGWTEPGKEVTVSLGDKSAKAAADAQGKWLAKLPAFEAGGPHEISITGPQAATLKNVLFGDVWVCSGQSNMQMSVNGSNNAEQERANATFPQIRLFAVPSVIGPKPQTQLRGQWVECGPQTVGGFSAAGYFFGRHLHQELKVPIGLINSSWGGTIAEAWVSAEGLKAMADFQPALQQLEEGISLQEFDAAVYQQRIAEWWPKNDPGSADGAVWAKGDFKAEGWKTMGVPGAWETKGLQNFDGIVWFRKEIEVPEAWAGKNLQLQLGRIDDRDVTWFNGERVGGMDVAYHPRNYVIPGKLVKAGRNALAIRVLDTGQNGGFIGKPEELKLFCPGDPTAPAIALAADWLCQESTAVAKFQSPLPQFRGSNPNQVTVLSNAMIEPLIPLAIKGAIWYQGESNASRALQYRTLLPALIKDWRTRFAVGDFPFLVVQLANFMKVQEQPSEGGWAEIREAQLMTALNVPNCGLAVIIDIGDAADIHPKNKQDVGRRLGLAAQAIGYGQKIVYSGPIYKSMQVDGNKVLLSFDHVGGGLVAKGEKLQGFAIAGEDKKFVWADAAIDGETVLVSSPGVEKPVSVRYAWANNPVCNLYNKEGIPASSFRTDQ